MAFLGALCMFLSTVELIIPRPLPFLRVGIANLPILLAMDVLPPRKLFLVAVLKVLGQALIGGTLISAPFLLSAAGTTAAVAVMLGVRRAAGPSMGCVGVSVMGALASNITQIVLARFIILGSGAWLVAPPFLAVGTVTSVLLGLFAEAFRARSRWWKAFSGSAWRSPAA